MTSRTRAGMHAPDGLCRIGGKPSRLLEIIRGPQADLLLFTGLSPTRETICTLQKLEESVGPLTAHVRARYVFPSQACASEAKMSEGDPRAIVDGQGKLHAAFGITRAEVVYLRPDGYVGLRSGSLDAQSLSEYLRLIYASHLASRHVDGGTA